MYYPKSKILENQHTDGGQLTDPSTGKTYKGLYHVTFDGKYFTGATHTLDSKQLVLANSNAPVTGSINHLPAAPQLVSPRTTMNVTYDTISNDGLKDLKSQTIPPSYFPVVTEDDYAAGNISRYFMKFGSKITEISSDGYSQLKGNFLFQRIVISWKLTGPLYDTDNIPGIHDTNRRVINFAEHSFRGISLYLIDYIQFAKVS